jgi:hypothetical protein
MGICYAEANNRRKMDKLYYRHDKTVRSFFFNFERYLIRILATSIMDEVCGNSVVLSIDSL